MIKPHEISQNTGRRSWATAAFFIESMLLLLMLAFVVAVTMWVTLGALHKGDQSAQLQSSIYAAQNVAERFTADPMSMPEEIVQDNLRIECKKTLIEGATGFYVQAKISVYDCGSSSEPALYTIETASYAPASAAQNQGGR